MSQDTAPPLAGSGLPAGLEALSSLAVTVLNEHTNDAGWCAVCESAWPCDLVMLTDHSLAAL
jgi:hypothetical protein